MDYLKEHEDVAFCYNRKEKKFVSFPYQEDLDELFSGKVATGKFASSSTSTLTPGRKRKRRNDGDASDDEAEPSSSSSAKRERTKSKNADVVEALEKISSKFDQNPPQVKATKMFASALFEFGDLEAVAVKILKIKMKFRDASTALLYINCNDVDEKKLLVETLLEE